jgi:hypothetical protein
MRAHTASISSASNSAAFTTIWCTAFLVLRLTVAI